jgi:hypothetical protein
MCLQGVLLPLLLVVVVDLGHVLLWLPDAAGAMGAVCLLLTA